MTLGIEYNKNWPLIILFQNLTYLNLKKESLMARLWQCFAKVFTFLFHLHEHPPRFKYSNIYIGKYTYMVLSNKQIWSKYTNIRVLAKYPNMRSHLYRQIFIYLPNIWMCGAAFYRIYSFAWIFVFIIESISEGEVDNKTVKSDIHLWALSTCL